MAVVIEREIWEPKPLYYIFLFASCFASVVIFPYFSRSRGGTGAPLDLSGAPSASFLRFQRGFLVIYSLASVIEGLEVVLGEYQYTQYGLSREQTVLCLSAGVAAALFIGTLLGVVCDVMGPRKGCLLFWSFHIFVGVLKSMSRNPSIWLISISLALASSLFLFSFEAWMVLEHEKQGHKQELLNETFWLMRFFESASFVGSQVLANLLSKDLGKGFISPSSLAALLGIVSILCIRRQSTQFQQTYTIGNYTRSFLGLLRSDKRVYLLACAQACIELAMSSFWLLWAPTIVADGREVNLSLLYPCFLGARMLGSTMFPWFFGGPSIFGNEGCLIGAFVAGAISLLTIAYDYQEIGVLVTVFCIFHASAGFILPSLARLRTVYIPTELRGGIMSVSMAPANAATLWILIQGGYYRNIGNSTIMALSALSLLLSAACIHVLRRSRKHPRQDWHTL